VMLVDDTLAVVGGLSLNPMSLDFRREVALTVTEPSAVGRVASLFEAVEASEAARILPDAAERDTAC